VSAVIDLLAARVHGAYVDDKLASGEVSVLSRHGTGDLLRPYSQLDERDKEDDRRTVCAVLQGLAGMPWVQVCHLLLSLKDDRDLLAEVGRAATVCDPQPAGLGDRCVEAAAREDRGDA
jgi:hypothetical protein